MLVRRAEKRDIPRILELLFQVDMVHHEGRPDLFKGPATKYNAEELAGIVEDDDTPVFVCENETGIVVGHAFCIHKQVMGDSVLTDVRTLYIDDICVDGSYRGKGVGKALYQYVVEYAKAEGFYNITLNVWNCNPGAMKFYEAMGLVPQKVCMECVLSDDGESAGDTAADGIKGNTDGVDNVVKTSDRSERSLDKNTIPEEYVILPAVEADRKEILALYNMQKGRPFCPWSEAYPSDETIDFDLERDALFVMKEDGRVIAAISIDEDGDVNKLACWDLDLAPGGELSRLAVLPDMQSRGIARRMIEYSMDELRKRGFKSLHFLVNRYNVKALRSYAHMGFNNVGECHMYEQDFFCYEKEL